MKIMKIMENLKICIMSKITIKTFVKGLDKYIEERQHLYKDFNGRKINRIKHNLFDMVIECLDICLHLFNKERYIEITNIIILDIVGNYNEYLPFTKYNQSSIFIIVFVQNESNNFMFACDRALLILCVTLTMTLIHCGLGLHTCSLGICTIKATR